MSKHFEFDFHHTIEKDDDTFKVYILVKGSFDRAQDDVNYDYIINKDVSKEDLSDLIKFLDKEIKQEIEVEIENKVNEYITDSVNEWSEADIY